MDLSITFELPDAGKPFVVDGSPINDSSEALHEALCIIIYEDLDTDRGRAAKDWLMDHIIDIN